MEIIKFKTNVDSQDALSKVASFLDKEESIGKWNLDLESDDKILSLSGTDVSAQKIEKAFEEAGYKAEILRVTGISGGDL